RQNARYRLYLPFSASAGSGREDSQDVSLELVESGSDIRIVMLLELAERHLGVLARCLEVHQQAAQMVPNFFFGHDGLSPRPGVRAPQGPPLAEVVADEQELGAELGRVAARRSRTVCPDSALGG